MTTLRLDHNVEIDLVERDGLFEGLGGVRLGDTPLRSAERPMFVEIRTPDAVELCDYRLAGVDRDGADTVLGFTMNRRDGDLMDWMVHSVRNRRRLADWTARPAPAEGTRLELRLSPVARTLAGRSWMGFAYRYRYVSPDLPIYRLLDRGTWEPGGRATGCEFWLRNCFVPPIAFFESPEASYCTEWYLPGIVNPNIFQFLPLQTETQGFSFAAGPAGLLATVPTEVRHIRSMFAKPAGADVIVHWHEHCDDLALELMCSPVEVLFSPGATDTVERANAWFGLAQHVSRTLHPQVSITPERVCTYGMIEEWSLPDMSAYAEHGVPALAEAGMKMVGLANHFQNNMNTWGLANMCCTVDLAFAESYGGEQAVRRLCEAVHARGLAAQMWGNTSLSTLTPWFDEPNGPEQRIRFLPREGAVMEALAATDDAFVRNPSGALEADHYTPRFAVLNLRDPVVRAYWLDRWAKAHEAGIDSIFLDSSFNLSSDKFHFKAIARPALAGGATADQTHLLGQARPAHEPPTAILSQYRAHLELMADMQKLGYQYCNEDLGVFGTHRHGPDVRTRLDNLFLWPECIATFDARAVAEAGRNPDDVFFQGMAQRLMWILYWDIPSRTLSFRNGPPRGPFDEPSAWHRSIYAAFNRANEHMVERRILPGPSGVLYESPTGPDVLWAFEDFAMPFDGPRGVCDLTIDPGARPEDISEALDAKARHVYLLAAQR